jgi:hypothetical protein
MGSFRSLLHRWILLTCDRQPDLVEVGLNLFEQSLQLDVEKIQPLSLHHLDKSLRLGRHSDPERFYMCALRLVELVLCHLPSNKEQRLAQLVDHMNVITPLMQQCYMSHLNPSRLVPVWTRV